MQFWLKLESLANRNLRTFVTLSVFLLIQLGCEALTVFVPVVPLPLDDYTMANATMNQVAIANEIYNQWDFVPDEVMQPFAEIGFTVGPS